MVQAVIMGNQLRLMLQKPTPQESILRNGDWRHRIINQRGQKSYGTGYGIDMWWGYGTGNIALEDDGIVIKNTGDTQFQIEQFFEDQDAFDGNTYTLAVLVNGKIYTLTATIDLSLSLFDIHIYPFTHFGMLFYKGQSNKFFVCLQCRDGISVKASAVKLEPGKRFTGWPAWDYGAELRKCQRYFYKTVLSSNVFFQMNGIAYKSNELDSILFLPVTMREDGKPVIQYSAGEKLAAWSPKNDSWGSTTHNITDIILEQFSGNQALLSIATTGLDIGENYFWQTKGGYISFSRDL
ncbi:hypothetical protein D7Y09_17335 [bacterium 1XD42-1]|nr:hypothetical protein D7X25_34185 [bacterium 1XD42-8]RKJ60498.1 hypothetical protein D7Y09_17335 [bacterium 1XD42-1]